MRPALPPTGKSSVSFVRACVRACVRASRAVPVLGSDQPEKVRVSALPFSLLFSAALPFALVDVRSLSGSLSGSLCSRVAFASLLLCVAFE